MVRQTGFPTFAGIAMIVSTRLIQRLAVPWVLICSAFFYFWSIANPHAEWDMLVYAASAEMLNSTPSAEIHPKVYAELESRLSTEDFARLTSGDHYRTVMYEDPDAFMEQLPYYRIRVTFNSILAFAGRHGISVYSAGHVISATAMVLCFLTIWFVFRQHIHPFFQMAMPVVFYKYTRELEVMQQILADSLASLWVALICFTYVRKSTCLLPLIAVSVLVRVDLFIFAFLMLFLLLLTEKIQKWGPILLTGCGVLCAFMAIQYWADSYGWKSLYYFAILSEMSATHPSVYSDISFSLSEYLYSLVYPPRWISKMFWVTMFCSIVTLLLKHNRMITDYQRRVCEVSGICLLYIAAHYLIFPQMYLRFFVAQNMIIFTAFAIVVSGYIRFPLVLPGNLNQYPYNVDKRGSSGQST